jgi:hypothetical protein
MTRDLWGKNANPFTALELLISFGYAIARHSFGSKTLVTNHSLSLAARLSTATINAWCFVRQTDRI